VDVLWSVRHRKQDLRLVFRQYIRGLGGVAIELEVVEMTVVDGCGAFCMEFS